MKKTSYNYFQYNRLTLLYRKLNNRLNRHFFLGRFYTFTKQQQYKLLNRLEKIKAKLLRLEQILKVSVSAVAVGLGINIGDVQAQTPKGDSEFKVTGTIGINRARSATNKSTGDFIVVWEEPYGAYAHLYDANGNSLGGDFLVSSSGNAPSVAMDRDGDFVITYYRTTGGSEDIYARRYNASGLLQGAEFRVNTYLTNDQWFPSVAMDNDGDFVITWAGAHNNGIYSGIYAQRL